MRQARSRFVPTTKGWHRPTTPSSGTTLSRIPVLTPMRQPSRERTVTATARRAGRLRGDAAMVQITVLIVAVAAGTFGRSWRQAWLITLIAFLVTSAIQTPMVIADDDIDSPLVYWTIQAITLGVGVGLARA